MFQNTRHIYIKKGFTLLEIITAVTIYSVLTLAVGMLLQNAIRLRDQAQELALSRQARVQVKSIMQRDLLNITAPNGDLGGWLISQNDVLGGERRDQLELFTSTGILSNGAYQSDIQKIVYALIPNTNDLEKNSLSLTRYIYRYVLSDYDDNPMQNNILDSVNSLAFEFYDGETWYSEWDSTEQDPPMPKAVKVSLAYTLNTDHEQTQTLNFLVPVQVMPYEDEEDEGENSSSESETNQQTTQQLNVGGQGGGNAGGAR